MALILSVNMLLVTLSSSCFILFFFFFQAEDGIRDYKVTGVQTCALPIYDPTSARLVGEREVASEARPGFQADDVARLRLLERGLKVAACGDGDGVEIGRASCRERV